MLPFDKKPWAKTLAKVVIAATILGIAAAAFYLHSLGPLDTGETLAFFLLALAIIPTNLAVIFKKPKEAGEHTAGLSHAVHHRP